MKAFRLASLGAFALAAALAAPSAHAKDWKSVTIALEGAYEPYNFTKPDGTIDGFEPELAKDICARAKLQCKLIAQDWDGLIAGLQAGKFDVIMDALSITDERKQVIAFSVPYVATPGSFAVVKDGPLAKLPGSGTTLKLTADAAKTNPEIQALRTALKGKTIGVQTATTFSKFINDEFADVATIREYKTAAERDLDLVAGRTDASFDDSTVFISTFTKPETKNLGFSGPQIAGPIWGEGEALGLRKSDTDLKAKFDAAITAALADGTVKKLSVKWFTLDVTP